MTKFYFLSLAAALLFLVSCKTASKAYNQGDYADAIELSVKSLQKDPYDTETKALLKNAYTYVVNQHESKIRTLANSASENRYESILQQYTKLQAIYETIQQSPAAANAVNPTNYSEYVETYRNKAAEIFLANAEKWMEEGTKRSYREAYHAYGQALRFVNSADIKRKREDAYNAALTKILVVPIQNYGRTNYHTSYQLQQFQNDVMRTLAYNMNNNFVRFFSEWDLRNKNLEPDQVLEMNLGRILLGRPVEQQSVREVSKQVVVKETVFKPDSIVKQYATVKAKVITTRRTLLSEGDLYMSIREIDGKISWNDRFTGQHRWQTEWVSYTGDERALSDNDRKLLENNPANAYPSENEIMAELYRQIQQDLSARLRGYFTRF